MLKLFQYKDYKVEVAPEALILEPFKLIWDRDKTKNKSRATMELGFIYFMADPRSDYQYIVDEEERREEINSGLGNAKDWKPDKDLLNAIEFYKSFVPTTAKLLQSTLIAVDKLNDFLKNVNFYEKDEKGKYILPINQVTQAIKQIPILAKDVRDAEAALNRDMQESSRIRGQVQKAILEDNI